MTPRPIICYCKRAAQFGTTAAINNIDLSAATIHLSVTALQSSKINLYSTEVYRQNKLQALTKTTIDYLDYVPGIGNTQFVWIIRVGVHPNNSWSAFEDNSPITPLFASWTLLCVESVPCKLICAAYSPFPNVFVLRHYWEEDMPGATIGFRTCTGRGRLYTSHTPVTICLRHMTWPVKCHR